MRCVREAHLANLANQVSVRSVVGPVMLIRQLRIMQHKQTHHSFITVNMQRTEDVIGLYIRSHIPCMCYKVVCTLQINDQLYFLSVIR